MNHPADALQDLRRECERRLNEPHGWEVKDLAKDFVLDLMRCCVETTPRKGVTADLTADLCDLFGPYGAAGMKGTYKLIAELTCKTPEAVRKSYERKFGLTKS